MEQDNQFRHAPSFICFLLTSLTWQGGRPASYAVLSCQRANPYMWGKRSRISLNVQHHWWIRHICLDESQTKPELFPDVINKWIHVIRSRVLLVGGRRPGQQWRIYAEKFLGKCLRWHDPTVHHQGHVDHLRAGEPPLWIYGKKHSVTEGRGLRDDTAAAVIYGISHMMSASGGRGIGMTRTCGGCWSVLFPCTY